MKDCILLLLFAAAFLSFSVVGIVLGAQCSEAWIFPNFQQDQELMIHGHLCVLQNRRFYATSITARPMRQNSDAWELSYDTVAADFAPAGSAAGEAAGVDKLITS